MKNTVSIDCDLTIGELAALLGIVEQAAFADLSFLPKDHVLDVKSLYEKLVKIVEDVQSTR
jgi:hypothetical protein